MNELTTLDPSSFVPDVANQYQNELSELSGSGGFLPRMQLCSSQSDACKLEKVPINQYALVKAKDEYLVLGREVDVAIISWRPRAIDASDKQNVRATSDTKSELFLEIKERHNNEQNSGCMYGPEFLIWIPSIQEFATVLFGSKTSRNEVGKVSGFVGKPCTFKSRSIDNGTYKWQAMVVTSCSTPFSPPDRDLMNAITEQFQHPKEQLGNEEVEEPATRTR